MTNLRPKNRDQKRLEAILVETTDVAKLVGLHLFALGQAIAYTAVSPKGAAGKIQMAAGQFLIVSEELTTLANKLRTWDTERIITDVKKPLVDVTGKAL